MSSPTLAEVLEAAEHVLRNYGTLAPRVPAAWAIACIAELPCENHEAPGLRCGTCPPCQARARKEQTDA